MGILVTRRHAWIDVAVAAFVLHFLWEMLQSPLFEGMSAAPHGFAVKTCLRATLGNVAIALIAFLSAARVGGHDWIRRPHASPAAAFLATGLAITVLYELLATRVLHRYEYAATMPTILGIGLVPIAQWIVIPLLLVGALRERPGLPLPPHYS